MLNAHLNSFFQLAKPFRPSSGKFDFKDAGKVSKEVKSDIPVMLRERLTPPPDETYSLHRKLSGCFLLCGKLQSKIPCATEFAQVYQIYKNKNEA
jgi:aarF domain-containing kinase